VRQGQHPLADGEAAEHLVDQVHRQGRHPAARTGGTEAASLAGEGDEQVALAGVAAEAGEDVRQLPAGQELAQLALDERPLVNP
jgi:hypothetical protein